MKYKVTSTLLMIVSKTVISSWISKNTIGPSKKCFGISSSSAGISSRKSLSSSNDILAQRLDGINKPTVWHEFSPLANKYNSINLGQGFPDWEPPNFVMESMIQSIDPKYKRNANQYARSASHLPLASVLAEEYTNKLGRDKDINPETEVATAVGCSNALYCALQGLINSGDEVIMLEPAFDIYMAQVKITGGTGKFVPLRYDSNKILNDDDDHENLLHANDVFTLDMDEFENAITDRTRVFILNTPHNPTGKIFSRDELYQIAKVLKKYPNIIVIADEVYEHIVFEPDHSPHISIASIPGMYDRTLTLSSAGKTFSATGWKIGWAIGPPHLVHAVTSVQQWVNFCAPTPNQDAISLSLKKATEEYYDDDNNKYQNYYKYLASEYLRKRNIVLNTIQKYTPMSPIVPSGGFFIMCDTSKITNEKYPTFSSYLNDVTEAMPTNPMPRDWAMSRWMTKEVGVTAIPPSAFYEKDHCYLGKDLLRFAFCKNDLTLLEAESRFQKYFPLS